MANQVAEVALVSGADYANPFMDAQLDAVVTQPDGTQLRVPGFWAGGGAWRFRYASDKVGTHTWRTECTDTARPTPLQPIANGVVAPAIPPAAPSGSIVRQLTLNEVIGPGGPLELVVNNSKYGLNAPPDPTVGCTTPLCRETELPAVGDTEIWEIINITADAHPMHTHLTSFQLMDRTPFQAASWINQYDALLLANGVLPGGGPPNQYNVRNADGAIGGNPAINTFLQLTKRRLPLPQEMGWKDTVITYPGEVTRIAVRWAPQDAPVTVTAATPLCPVPTPPLTPPTSCVPQAGSNTYPFDPTALVNGVGYVWHCHILDHEDNEMMRTYTVMSARQPIQ